MEELYLGLEGGGSKTRALLADASGVVLGRKAAGPASALYVSPSQFHRQAAAMLRPLKKIADQRKAHVTRAAVAGPMYKDIAARVICEIFGRVQVHDISEGEVALACHHLDWGLAIVAGTGSSGWVLRRDKPLLSCGGFGPQFGDEGSAYWIGKEGLAAAARAEDGRGPHTGILKRVFEHFGVQSVRQLYTFCDTNGHLLSPTVAGLARLVVEAADAKDAVARGILRNAGRALAQMALVMLERAAFEDEPVPLAPAGGVFRAGGHVLKPLQQTLARVSSRIEVYPAVIEPAEGLIHYLMLRYDKDKRSSRQAPPKKS